MQTILTYNEQETIDAGKQFALTLQPGDVVACYGDLGAGKTRFIKGVCETLGVHKHVTSPTFTIMNVYTTETGTIYHFDLYRITSPDELFELGFEEYTTGTGICLIEWAEKAEEMLPRERYDVQFVLGASENERQITVRVVAEITA